MPRPWRTGTGARSTVTRSWGWGRLSPSSSARTRGRRRTRMEQLRRVDKHEVTILLAEDDPGHALLIAKNLRRAGITNPLVTIGNGRAALDYVLTAGEGAGPLLVL